MDAHARTRAGEDAEHVGIEIGSEQVRTAEVGVGPKQK
jgi:hypothetical protein